MVFNPPPDILALDFDGVICDGLIEYFQTAWTAYCQVWQPADTTPPEGLAEQFYPLRPVIETGWEMPVLLRSLLLNIDINAIVEDWPAVAQAQIAVDGLEQKVLAAAVDGGRDRWIQTDLEHWLSQHRFYPGVLVTLEQFLQSSTHTVIISTKEGRFIHQLLQQQGVDMPRELIYGKEVKRPKYETLRLLIQELSTASTSKNISSPPNVVFIEDRLKALQTTAQQPDLDFVQLYLADWGYNMAAERDRVQQEQQAGRRIQLLTLADFATT
ncbi:MAG: HAD family hydrolase [Cyanothece sp. SIO2G6]|nr:HAD family hydrolase [Cyanothece sp. SIO2G6]